LICAENDRAFGVSQDLVMRKLLMNPGQFNYRVFKKRILAATDAAYKSGVDPLLSLLKKPFGVWTTTSRK
jgi:hypothetical protein